MITAILAFSSTSCDVDGDVNGNNEPDTVESFTDLNADVNFDWKTSKDYTLNFNGIPVTNQIKKPLTIKTASGKIIRKMNISLSDNISIDLRVPSKEETLKLSWGTYEKEVSLEESPLIDFTFLEPNTDEE
jgi:hypothetical protein